jgi:hypothetical protein
MDYVRSFTMDIKFIIIAVLAMYITAKVFASAKALPAVVGFCGVFTMLLVAWNAIASKIH